MTVPPRPLALLAGLALALAAGPAAAQAPIPPPPNPPRLVNDFAGLLAPAEREALERKLVALDDTTSTQIAVVILRTLDGAAASEFATELGHRWGVGGGAQDNGFVVLVSLDDRQVFIATGYGAEGAVTDAVAGRIVRNVMVPAFREGRFYAGLDAATDALAAATRGEFTAERGAPGEGLPVELIVMLVLLAVVLLSLARHGGQDDGRGGRRRRRGGPGVVFVPWGFSGGGGGGWSSGGGFSGGGGFGGFGGGGFGGGGAGGSW